jgi:hypothetical protein
MVDTFVTQFDDCNYLVDGKPSGGKNCTCACHAMWLFRASGGKIKLSSCQCRMRTGDRFGGTHLGQMEQISKEFGITTGKVYRPLAVNVAIDLLLTGRYGSHWQGSNAPYVGTPYDASRGRFFGNHDWYISGPGTAPKTFRAADPQRLAGYRDIPIELMVRSAARLDMGDGLLGPGKVYCYFTPPDPIPPVTHYKAIVSKTTQVYNDSTGQWVYKLPVGTKLEVRGKQFPKGGVATYPVTCGTYACEKPGYYVPVDRVKLGGKV